MQARGGGAAQIRGGATWIERNLAGDRRRRPGGGGAGGGEHHGGGGVAGGSGGGGDCGDGLGGGEHHGDGNDGWNQHYKHKSFSIFRNLRKSLLIY